MNDDNKFDVAISRALQARALPEASTLFMAKLLARCTLDKQIRTDIPQGLTPVYAAAGSLVMGLLIGIMLFSTLNPPVAPTAAADNSASILYHYIYKSAV